MITLRRKTIIFVYVFKEIFHDEVQKEVIQNPKIIKICIKLRYTSSNFIITLNRSSLVVKLVQVH